MLPVDIRIVNLEKQKPSNNNNDNKTTIPVVYSSGIVTEAIEGGLRIIEGLRMVRNYNLFSLPATIESFSKNGRCTVHQEAGGRLRKSGSAIIIIMISATRLIIP